MLQRDWSSLQDILIAAELIDSFIKGIEDKLYADSQSNL